MSGTHILTHIVLGPRWVFYDPHPTDEETKHRKADLFMVTQVGSGRAEIQTHQANPQAHPPQQLPFTERLVRCLSLG